MELDPQHRLTSLRGSADIKAHPWFRPLGVSWKEVEEGRLIPSFAPGIEEDEQRIAGAIGALMTDSEKEVKGGLGILLISTGAAQMLEEEEEEDDMNNDTFVTKILSKEENDEINKLKRTAFVDW